MGKWNRWGRTLAAVVLAAAVVCGCGVKETLLSGRKSEREYGKAETMVIVTTERLRYEELYTDKIWDTVVDESGTTFEETLLSQIHDFLKELKTMSRMADEEKVTLSGKERELAKQAAAQYIHRDERVGIPALIEGKRAEYKRRGCRHQRASRSSCASGESRDLSPFTGQDHKSSVVFARRGGFDDHPGQNHLFSHILNVFRIITVVLHVELGISPLLADLDPEL